jgi:hypothetical protein
MLSRSHRVESNYENNRKNNRKNNRVNSLSRCRDKTET